MRCVKAAIIDAEAASTRNTSAASEPTCPDWEKPKQSFSNQNNQDVVIFVLECWRAQYLKESKGIRHR